MNIKERLASIQKKMEDSISSRVSYEKVREYEIQLNEIISVSDWLKAQCNKNNVIHFDKRKNEDISYLEFENDSPFDFKLIKIRIDILGKNGLKQTIVITVNDWKRGINKILAFNYRLEDNDILSVNPDYVEYIIL